MSSITSTIKETFLVLKEVKTLFFSHSETPQNSSSSTKRAHVNNDHIVLNSKLRAKIESTKNDLIKLLGSNESNNVNSPSKSPRKKLKSEQPSPQQLRTAEKDSLEKTIAIFNRINLPTLAKSAVEKELISTQMQLMRTFSNIYNQINSDINKKNPKDVTTSNEEEIYNNAAKMQEIRMVTLPKKYPFSLSTMNWFLQLWRGGFYGEKLQTIANTQDPALLSYLIKACLIHQFVSCGSLEEFRACELLRDIPDDAEKNSPKIDSLLKEGLPILTEALSPAQKAGSIVNEQAADTTTAEECHPNFNIYYGILTEDPSYTSVVALLQKITNIIHFTSPPRECLPLLLSLASGIGNINARLFNEGILLPLDNLWIMQNLHDSERIDAIVIDTDLGFCYTFSDDEDDAEAMSSSTSSADPLSLNNNAPPEEYIEMVLDHLEIFPRRLQFGGSSEKLMISILTKMLLKDREHNLYQRFDNLMAFLPSHSQCNVLRSLLQYGKGYDVQFALPEIGDQRIVALITDRLLPRLGLLHTDPASEKLNADFSLVIENIHMRQELEKVEDTDTTTSQQVIGPPQWIEVDTDEESQEILQNGNETDTEEEEETFSHSSSPEVGSSELPPTPLFNWSDEN